MQRLFGRKICGLLQGLKKEKRSVSFPTWTFSVRFSVPSAARIYRSHTRKDLIHIRSYTSEAEWLDVKLAQAMEPASFQAAANAALPAGFRILEVIEASENAPALTALMEAAEYTIEFQGFNLVSGPKELETAFASMVAGPIFVDKRTKGGIKTVDIRPLLLNYQFSLSADGCPLLTLLGVADAKGSLNIDLLLGALRTFCAETTYTYNVHRKAIYFKSGSLMPALPHK